MYFESHAHYDDVRYDSDRAEVIEKIQRFGVEYCINIGADMPSTKSAIALAEQYDFMYAAIGVHPHEAEQMRETDLETLAEWSRHEKVVAIGEIGLDFYYDHSPRDVQRYWFAKQLELSKTVDLPVVIHSRDAALEVLQIIQQSGVNRGVIHCYSGGAEMALQYVEMGFYIGIGGVVTFKNAKKVVEAVTQLPLDRILLETDCPYLAPTPHRGERNDSTKLKYIAEKIAELKHISPEEVVEITKKNALCCFLSDL